MEPVLVIPNLDKEMREECFTLDETLRILIILLCILIIID